MKRVPGSTVRDPENRSRKACACGGHSAQSRKRVKWGNKKRPRQTRKELHREAEYNPGRGLWR